MPALTSEGETLVRDLVARHGFGEAAVTDLLAAMVAGHGRAAQFAHPELGGGGQWMSGGMLMIGDMFDNALKARVGALCDDLARAVTSAGTASAPAPSQRQAQGGGNDSSGHLPGTPFFEASVPGGSDAWWPRELGTPSASGAQGATRYAHFADARRLALDDGREVRVHDTLDHRIGGFSQRQGGGGDGLTLSSQHGTVDIATLPVVSRGGRAEPAAPADAPPEPAPSTSAPSVSAPPTPVVGAPAPADDDPLRLIERLGRLRDQGLVSEEEFADKKRELLARL